jgi:hypothetical protein
MGRCSEKSKGGAADIRNGALHPRRSFLSIVTGGVDAAPPLPAALDRRRDRAGLLHCDANGQTLAAVYREHEPGRREAAKLVTRDEARRIAANIAKLPELTRRPPP